MEQTIDTQSTQPTESTNQGDKVSDALKVYSVDEKGKVVIPQGTPSYVETALKLEQQRRDSNSNYGKERARGDKLEVEMEALKVQMAGLVGSPTLTADQTAELEELKFTDPDAWFQKKTEMDKLNSSLASTRVADAVTQASKDADVAYTAKVTKGRDESVGEMLTKHNALNPETPITMDMLNLDIPPVLVNRYHKGELDSLEFLGKVSKFLYADTVIKTEPTMTQPNLADGVSTVAPTETAETKSLEQVYAGL